MDNEMGGLALHLGRGKRWLWPGKCRKHWGPGIREGEGEGGGAFRGGDHHPGDGWDALSYIMIFRLIVAVVGILPLGLHTNTQQGTGSRAATYSPCTAAQHGSLGRSGGAVVLASRLTVRVSQNLSCGGHSIDIQRSAAWGCVVCQRIASPFLGQHYLQVAVFQRSSGLFNSFVPTPEELYTYLGHQRLYYVMHWIVMWWKWYLNRTAWSGRERGWLGLQCTFITIAEGGTFPGIVRLGVEEAIDAPTAAQSRYQGYCLAYCSLSSHWQRT